MTNTTAEQPSTDGRCIGPYILDRLLGRGAHGAVYLARHRSGSGAPVALKLIDRGPDLDRLLIEPTLLSRLAHPNIVQLKNYFIEGSRLVLVMAYAPGVDLEAYLQQKGRLQPDEVRSFLKQMAYALAHAHAQCVIHRDLKPSNVLVQENGGQTRFVLTDFSVASMATGVQFKRRTGGTYHFMAPEQLRGRPGPQSDLWALGVIAYMMLTGSRPFNGSTLEELSQNVHYRTPTPPSHVTGGTDEDLDQIILRLLEKQSERRAGSPEELLTALRATPRRGPMLAVPSSDAPEEQATFEELLRGRLLKTRVAMVMSGLLLLLLSNGGPGALLLVLGWVLLYQGYRGETNNFTVLTSLIVLFVGTCVNAVWIPDSFTEPGLVVSLLDKGATMMSVAGMHFLAKQRRLSGEIGALMAIRHAAMGPDALILYLGNIIKQNPSDIALRQRYAETLFDSGYTDIAVVEARLIIQQDPYNIGAMLLLVHGYFELGLYQSAIEACDAYLSVFGHSFELTMMKQRSMLALTA